MNKNITIGGVDIATLKAQKAAMQQEASAFVSNAIEEGSALVKKLLEAESEKQANELAEQALEAFDSASIVAGVCGVCFFMPYYEPYGGYDSSEILSRQLYDAENEFVVYDYKVKNVVYRLSGLLEDMEQSARGWHSSTC